MWVLALGAAALRNLTGRSTQVVLAVTHNVLANDYKLTEAVPEIDLLLVRCPVRAHHHAVVGC